MPHASRQSGPRQGLTPQREVPRLIDIDSRHRCLGREDKCYVPDGQRNSYQDIAEEVSVWLMYLGVYLDILIIRFAKLHLFPRLK